MKWELREAFRLYDKQGKYLDVISLCSRIKYNNLLQIMEYIPHFEFRKRIYYYQYIKRNSTGNRFYTQRAQSRPNRWRGRWGRKWNNWLRWVHGDDDRRIKAVWADFYKTNSDKNNNICCLSKLYIFVSYSYFLLTSFLYFSIFVYHNIYLAYGPNWILHSYVHAQKQENICIYWQYYVWEHLVKINY